MASVAGVKRPFATAALGWNHQGPIQPAPSIAAHSTPVQHPRPPAHQISRSSTNSPLPFATPLQPPKFAADASIFLTGMPGAGKSTLAIIASTSMQRKLVDVEKAFETVTGLSSKMYKKEHGADALQRRQAEFFREIAVKHAKNCVVVCSWSERAQGETLLKLSGTHAVIHIVRDAKAIEEYLGPSHMQGTTIVNLLDASSYYKRKYCSFEFFNVSEDATVLETSYEGGPGLSEAELKQRSPAPYLTLKRAERHFLKFLSLILPKDTIPFIESAFPLTCVPVEDRRFTYAMSIPLSVLLEKNLDIEELETGADAIEIVVDDLVTYFSIHLPNPVRLSPSRASEISRIMGQVRRNTVIPIIYHVEFPELAQIDESWRELYISYINHGLRLAPEFVSVDLQLGEDELSHLSRMKGNSKLIGNIQWSKSDAPAWSQPVWCSFYKKARDARCDMVRLTRAPADFADNFDVKQIHAAVEALGEPRIPLIAYNTGPLGRTSACFNQVLTSVAPYKKPNGQHTEQDSTASYPRPSVTGPSITALQATEALYSSFVFDPMKLYVFGANVGYSLSPAMHNKALRELGIRHQYKPHSAASISSLRELVHDPHFAGASVGLPFKIEIITLTHTLSCHAQAIGAVNTLIPVRSLNKDGTIPEDALLFNSRNRAGPVQALYGENTDWIGIRACIRRGLSPANAVRSTSSALVVGAGGMARATVYALLQLGVKNIVVFNRTVANAKSLVAHFEDLLSRDRNPLISKVSRRGTRFHVLETREDEWPEDACNFPTMIVSCIPTHSIGDSPAPEFKLPTQWLGSETGGVVVELAYKTLDTPLLVQMRKEAHKGWVVMDGLDLLPEQGFAQFELFTGRRAPRRLMRKEVFNSYRDDQGRPQLAQLQPRLDNITEQEP